MDEIDLTILEELRRNARLPVGEIARRVGLSSAPVSRRIAKLESDGVITGYTALIDESTTGEMEAFTEVRLTAGTDTSEVESIARDVPEVQQFYTIAGDTDALVRFRVRNVDHLQRVVNAIRRTGKVEGTKTLIVMRAWDRSSGDR
ncbi:Lrp/AsnC family transcriptional regulator [Microbacterium aoyamense]|uniref:Lrp/AsnC family transcriptional regulator n=1 Tax=Microbacterium aoyamense TaxID=344166 RepID=A0ABN2PFT5_9MICO|nr:Lrp/AsnC family transcriptional regulator [Microbacterium aoyamense]